MSGTNSKITMCIEHITPEIAKEYLEKNINNRKPSTSRIKMYADDMASGKWQANGDAIRFNVSGALIDGQHRLMAVVKSGVTVDMIVIRNISDDVTLIDRGQARTTAQTLSMSGMEYNLRAGSIVGMVKFILSIYTGDARVSDTKVKEFILNNKEAIQTVYRVVSSINKTTVNVRSAAFMAAIYNALGKGVDSSTLKRFAYVVGTGLSDTRKERAAVVLRNDILSKTVNWNNGDGSRIKALQAIEKAIMDFSYGKERKLTYKSVHEYTYFTKEQLRMEV